MDKKIVAQDVAAHLFEAEAALDHVLSSASRLLDVMVCARGQLKLSPVFGSDPFRRVTKVINSLGEARDELVAAHGGLHESQLRMGMRTISFGDLDKPPELATATPVEVVASRRRTTTAA